MWYRGPLWIMGSAHSAHVGLRRASLGSISVMGSVSLCASVVCVSSQLVHVYIYIYMDQLTVNFTL